ncbi:hypothetical protein GCM10010254_55200 [Streptomyces chromofuscus]|nr:hypothetical protein GCM10010254_55200 [Streptomyces chromofuscus]
MRPFLDGHELDIGRRATTELKKQRFSAATPWDLHRPVPSARPHAFGVCAHAPFPFRVGPVIQEVTSGKTVAHRANGRVILGYDGCQGLSSGWERAVGESVGQGNGRTLASEGRGWVGGGVPPLVGARRVRRGRANPGRTP